MKRTIRRATADDYTEPLRSKILRGEAEIPDEYVVEDRWHKDEAPFTVFEPPVVDGPPDMG
jgi:hypothetical protein